MQFKQHIILCRRIFFMFVIFFAKFFIIYSVKGNIGPLQFKELQVLIQENKTVWGILQARHAIRYFEHKLTNWHVFIGLIRVCVPLHISELPLSPGSGKWGFCYLALLIRQANGVKLSWPSRIEETEHQFNSWKKSVNLSSLILLSVLILGTLPHSTPVEKSCQNRWCHHH